MKSVYSRIVLEVMIPSEWSVENIKESGVHDYENPNSKNKIEEAVAAAKAKLAEDLLAISPEIEVR